MARIFDLTEWPTPATYLFEQHADLLARVLAPRFRALGPDRIYDAIMDAILDISLKIDRFDDLDDLGGLLRVAATRNLLDVVRSQQARGQRDQEKGIRSVARSEAAARKERDLADAREILERIFREIPQSDEERTVLEHWGETFQEIALALGWGQLSQTEQRRRVKTLRDRVAQRLKRFLEEPDHEL
jgi:DNA-directed RNA polymerase specialized sigma24 family protein